MPMDKKRYPANWKEIARSVKNKANWTCQQCGAKHGDPLSSGRNFRVVITVHHAGVPYPDGSPGNPHDKMDCRPENLIALCQRCHWIADLPIHLKNAKAARIRRKNAKARENGQRELF